MLHSLPYSKIQKLMLQIKRTQTLKTLVQYKLNVALCLTHGNIFYPLNILLSSMKCA